MDGVTESASAAGRRSRSGPWQVPALSRISTALRPSLGDGHEEPPATSSSPCPRRQHPDEGIQPHAPTTGDTRCCQQHARARPPQLARALVRAVCSHRTPWLGPRRPSGERGGLRSERDFVGWIARRHKWDRRAGATPLLLPAFLAHLLAWAKPIYKLGN